MGEEVQGQPIGNSVDSEREENNENAEKAVDLGEFSEEYEDDDFNF